MKPYITFVNQGFVDEETNDLELVEIRVFLPDCYLIWSDGNFEYYPLTLAERKQSLLDHRRQGWVLVK